MGEPFTVRPESGSGPVRNRQGNHNRYLTGVLVTYGGLLLLGGRAGDLLGRRRLLVAGTALFAACSLAGVLATSAGMLVGARLAQGAVVVLRPVGTQTSAR
jgi:MFS family permease